MNPDDHILGIFDPNNPINQKELPPLSELEQLQEDYIELRNKYLNRVKDVAMLISDLETLENQTYIVNRLKSIFKL